MSGLRPSRIALLVALPLGGLASCVSIPEPGAGRDGGSPDGDAVAAGCEDVDGDGYRPAGCDERVPADCNEADALVHPGAFDDCGTEIDEDCTGAALECQASLQPLVEVPEGPLNQGATRVESASGVVIFDADQAFAMTSLVSKAFGSANLIHDGTARERYVGSHMFPVVFSYDAPSAVVGRVAAGRAAMRYRVAWSVSGTGAESGTSLTGTTTYSLYPDGRIHRAEELSPAGSASFFSTYMALNPSAFSHRLDPLALQDSFEVLDEADLIDTPFVVPTLAGDPASAFEGRSCAYDEVGGLALSYAWNAYDRQDGMQIRMPQSRLDGEDSHQFAMVLDWQHSGDPTEATYRGAFQIALGTTSAHPFCTEFTSVVDGFLLPPPLLDHLPTVPDPGDANGDGYVEDGGFYAVDAAGGNSVLVRFGPNASNASASLPPSYSLQIRGLPNGFDPVLFVGASQTALSHGRDYLLHRESGDGSLWIFVNQPINPSVALNIVFP